MVLKKPPHKVAKNFEIQTKRKVRDRARGREEMNSAFLIARVWARRA